MLKQNKPKESNHNKVSEFHCSSVYVYKENCFIRSQLRAHRSTHIYFFYSANLFINKNKF